MEWIPEKITRPPALCLRTNCSEPVRTLLAISIREVGHQLSTSLNRCSQRWGSQRVTKTTIIRPDATAKNTRASVEKSFDHVTKLSDLTFQPPSCARCVPNCKAAIAKNWRAALSHLRFMSRRHGLFSKKLVFQFSVNGV